MLLVVTPQRGAWGAKPPSLTDFWLCLEKDRLVRLLAVGGMGAKPPPKKGGLGAKPPSLEIPNSVTGCYVFFTSFPAFHHLFTPPKTPSFPTGVLRDFEW